MDNFKSFTGWEYTLIDVANNFGLDKETFETRLAWANENLHQLEALAEGKQWKERPLYIKAVQAVRKAQKGIPTGHLIGFDAVCSGMQIMSALTWCESGARATGLIDPDRRADAYSDCTKLMIDILGYHIEGERDKVKNAVMTSLYGSKAEPKKEFGEDTPELQGFYKAMYQLTPGACELLDDLVNSWQAYTLAHTWQLPDGYQAYCKVMQQEEKRIEVDEMGHSTFTYTYYENRGERRGVKNAANAIHSIDAYVLRSLVRRCNYDEDVVRMAADLFEFELLRRSCGEAQIQGVFSDEVEYYVEQYNRSGMPDIVILDHLTSHDIRRLSDEHLQGLSRIVNAMLEHRSFPIVTVHDDFKCHPNNMNHLRKHYRQILAELAVSNVLDDILSQLYGYPVQFVKQGPCIADKIANSNYALC